MPAFSSETTTTTLSSTDGLRVPDAASEVGKAVSAPMPPTVGHPAAARNTSSAFVTPVAPLPSSFSAAAGMTSEPAAAPAWPSPQQSSVVAGVDVMQLPPLQRQLFLRMHQQQQQQQMETAVNSAPAASDGTAQCQPSAALIQTPGTASHLPL